MKVLSQPLFKGITVNGTLLDISALTFIYLVPTISHLLRVPVYLIEPMRLMLILALVHTNKRNSYFLALSMPLFSMLISGHPIFPKMVLIAFELVFNVFLFFLFAKKTKHLFAAIFTSIVISKSAYYLLKMILIQLALVHDGLISTPLLIQLGTSLVFSLYLTVFFKRQQVRIKD